MLPLKVLKPLTYRQSGVDIDAGDSLVSRIKGAVQKTHGKEVLAPLGGYAGLFAPDLRHYKKPILVSTTDGVGTKLRLALDINRLGGLGQDLVAMCVNDLICCGAKPLFFLDYFATGKLNIEQAEKLIASMAKALKEINCALIGGETAEMPGIYKPGDFDLAGFAVGLVDQEKMITGNTIKPGDAILGLPSSGPHSNGFSLIRKILEARKIDPKKDSCGLDNPIGLELIKPTLIYVNSILEAHEKMAIKGLAHITGGGLIENPPRIFPKNCGAILQRKKISPPPVFMVLQELGDVADCEMWRVFNMGMGMVIVVAPDQVDPGLKYFARDGVRVIGEIVKGKPEVHIV